ncbi:unnamed protein product [Meganyctiphanes norvegica]|uniref:Uncharacterized protein n=1 Tax=Meganyctiphanes norvegica TaxID=48144 RepID=A0AAV2QFF8_MEGNR
MVPVNFSLQSRIKSIQVLAQNLRICEESCNIEKSIKKIIGNGEMFDITVFTTFEYSIKFEVRDSRESGTINSFEIKPRDCILHQKNSRESILCNYIYPGWNKLKIFSNRTTLAINENVVLQTDDSLKSISISGSYLVNCTKGTPIWKVSDQNNIRIPITSGQEIVFGITSNADFLPTFNIDGIDIALSWNNGLKLGSSGKPLRPKSYYIIFEATSQMLILYNGQKTKEHLLMVLNVNKVPEFIMVSSLRGDYQLTLYVPDSYLRPPHQHTTEPPLVTGKPAAKPPEEDMPNSPLLPKIVIGILVPIGIAVIICFLVYGLKKMKDSKSEKEKELNGKSQREYAHLLAQSTPVITKVKYHDEVELNNVMVHSSYSSSSQSSSGMHEWVELIKSCNIERIERLITSGKVTIEDILVEAHIRDNMKVIQAIMKTREAQFSDLKEDKLIMEVMEVLGEHIALVFSAINKGKLYGTGSADSLLKEYGLHGTIRDIHGDSLLHCFVLQMSNPFYIHNEDNLICFLGEHKVLVAAVNYKGQTPLHTVATVATKQHDIDKWGNIAQILLKAGCEPSARDNNGKLPEDIALDRGCIYLQKLLTMNRMAIEDMNMRLKIDQWTKLQKGTVENNLEVVSGLILDNVPILPLSSTSDPLKMAICRGYVELTMLLLSTGAPLCGRPLVGLNSLEISHSTPGLTAFLPALIRREFYNCLRSETKLFTNKDTTWDVLKAAVLDLSEAIKKYGFKNVNWKFSNNYSDMSEKSAEARKLLSLAASMGMGLTCQMLGLEDVFLHPLPLEISPNSNAKPNTLHILCRDLDLSLSLKVGNIPSHLKEENENDNLNKLKKFCKSSSIDFHTLYDEESSINKTLLKYIAEQGLDTAYNIFRRRNGKLVDTVVDEVTGFTMLHTAAYNGRMGMVEYLLLNKAKETVKTKSGFSAAHVAAMRGHKECMEYILAFSKLSQSMVDDLTPSGLTAHQISQGYASEVKNMSTLLLHESVSHPILSEPKPRKKAELVLNEKQTLIKGCLSKESLDHIIPSGYKKEHRIIWQQLKEESENFIKKIKDIDSRFNGKTINHHRNEDALELLLMDSYQIYLEIEDNEYCLENDLPEAFLESGHKALQDYTVKSKNICIVPPVFKPTAIGANLFISYSSEQITTQISIHIIPVYKEKLDLNTGGLHLSQIFHDTIAQTSVTHFVKIKSDKCSYVTVDIEKQLFSKVDSSKLLVLNLCRYIKKILYPHWWFPRQESRRHGRQWRHYAVSLQSVPERLLIACFLWEVFKVPEEKWDTSNVLDRVIDIYKQMVIQDENGVMVASPNAKCFLDPGKEDIKVSPNIPVIIDFLQELRK